VSVTGNGSVVTVEYAPNIDMQFSVGSTVNISGVTPAGYNNAAAVVVESGFAANGNNFIKYNNVTTAAMTVAGTIAITTSALNAATYNGQTKTFVMYGTGYSMVMTVLNPGWKTTGTGTITFDTIGDSCIMQFINGKWFCIGHNGAVFA
jgi:hypothetical protein